MAEKMTDYYQITWLASGVQSPLLDKDQLMVAIEASLMHLSDSNTLTMSINQKLLSAKDFKNRKPELKGYSFNEAMN